MPDKVTCAACGLLAIRSSETWELCEADDLYRKEGQLGTMGSKRSGKPICLAGQAQLQESYETWRKLPGQSDEDSKIKVFNEERDCSSFQKWILGLAPKKHVDMLLLEKQREWQRQCGEEDRKWREDQSRQSDLRHAAQIESAEKHHRENLKVVADATIWNWRATLIAAGIGAISALLAGILGAAATLIVVMAGRGS